jgi:hypothetical protein
LLGLAPSEDELAVGGFGDPQADPHGQLCAQRPAPKGLLGGPLGGDQQGYRGLSAQPGDRVEGGGGVGELLDELGQLVHGQYHRGGVGGGLPGVAAVVDQPSVAGVDHPAGVRQ